MNNRELRLYRVLVGYRDDLDLADKWWHRLYHVLAFAICIGTPVAMAMNDNKTFQTPRNTILALQGGMIIAILLWIVVANIYYRGIIYIAFGRRA